MIRKSNLGGMNRQDGLGEEIDNAKAPSHER